MVTERTPAARAGRARGRPAVSAGDNTRRSGAQTRRLLAELLVLALFALSAVPNLLEKVGGGARQNTVSDIGPDLAVVRYTQLGLIALVLGACALLLLYRPVRLLGVALNPFVTCILLIWVMLTVNDL